MRPPAEYAEIGQHILSVHCRTLSPNGLHLLFPFCICANFAVFHIFQFCVFSMDHGPMQPATSQLHRDPRATGTIIINMCSVNYQLGTICAAVIGSQQNYPPKVYFQAVTPYWIQTSHPHMSVLLHHQHVCVTVLLQVPIWHTTHQHCLLYATRTSLFRHLYTKFHCHVPWAKLLGQTEGPHPVHDQAYMFKTLL